MGTHWLSNRIGQELLDSNRLLWVMVFEVALQAVKPAAGRLSKG